MLEYFMEKIEYMQINYKITSKKIKMELLEILSEMY